MPDKTIMKKQKLEYEKLTTINDLYDDAITEILVRLPPKSVVKLTRVSKSWNSLIRSPAFINKYQKDSCRSRYLLYMVEDPFGTSTIRIETSAEQRSNLMMPFHSFKVIGSCQGLVSVVNSYSQICLWNPFLQTTRILPPSPYQKAETKLSTYIVYGLGYSYKDNDHRVVKIIYEHKTGSSVSSNRVEIYSLKSNSWKSIDSVAPVLAGGTTGVFMNGRVNWMATPTLVTRGTWTMVMWFDIDKELFGNRLLPIKPQFLRKPQHAADAKEILGCDHDSNKKGSLWKTKALACENSWVKLRLNKIRVEKVTMFDGDILLQTKCNDMFRRLGSSVEEMPWDHRSSTQKFRIVCVSESLVLFNGRKHNNL